MFGQLSNKIIIFASFLVIVGYVWFRLKKISKNKIEPPPTQETCPSLIDLPIKLPLEWEISKLERKRLLLHLFPIIVSFITFIWLPLFVKEMGWRTGLSLGLGSAVALVIITLLALAYALKDCKVKITEQGIHVWQNKKEKFYPWNTLESFTDLSQTKGIVRNRGSRSSVNLGSLLQSYYKKVGGTFKIYLKPQKGHQVSEFNRFILVTEPENTKQVKNILSKYLNYQQNVYSKRYTLLTGLAPILVAFLIIALILVIFLIVD